MTPFKEPGRRWRSRKAETAIFRPGTKEEAIAQQKDHRGKVIAWWMGHMLYFDNADDAETYLTTRDRPEYGTFVVRAYEEEEAALD